MSYDPEARRDTPLARKLKQRIRRAGPMTVEDYVKACLVDPEGGYYVKQSAIGGGGDFITAPEISQIFGELIGLWSAVVWQNMGTPAAFNLVELGPGRGTLMRDALRAARRVEGFLAAAHVSLIDVNQPMRREQEKALAGAAPHLAWAASIADVDLTRPTIVIGNEYLDALGVAQLVWDGAAWRQRVVVLDGAGELAFEYGEPPAKFLPSDIESGHDLVAGTIIERGGFLQDANFRLLAEVPMLAGLFVDYGHPRSMPGETLQAVRRHVFEHPLTSPGEADLTVHVDFGAFAGLVRGMGLTADGPITQAEFLGRLGIIERASRLMDANPAHAGAIEMGVARLLAPNGMGSRFKAIGIRSASVAPLPGFEA